MGNIHLCLMNHYFWKWSQKTPWWSQMASSCTRCIREQKWRHQHRKTVQRKSIWWRDSQRGTNITKQNLRIDFRIFLSNFWRWRNSKNTCWIGARTRTSPGILKLLLISKFQDLIWPCRMYRAVRKERPIWDWSNKLKWRCQSSKFVSLQADSYTIAWILMLDRPCYYIIIIRGTEKFFHYYFFSFLLTASSIFPLTDGR